MDAGGALRNTILNRGLGLASEQGFAALTMGNLARELDLPRSGITSHFADRESLQLGVLEQAAAIFVRDVIEAAAASPAGAARLRALFVKWVRWSRAPVFKGGCPFVHASRQASELAEPVRLRLKEVLDAWSVVLTEAIDEGKSADEFRKDLDVAQMVFELHGLYLSHHFFHWYMKDGLAEQRTMKAFDRLVAANRG